MQKYHSILFRTAVAYSGHIMKNNKITRVGGEKTVLLNEKKYQHLVRAAQSIVQMYAVCVYIKLGNTLQGNLL